MNSDFVENKIWVLFRLLDNVYAISCDAVSSLFQLSNITPLPDYTNNVRGVIKYQQKIIQLLDIKKIFEIKTIEEEIKEFNELISSRKQEYIDWFSKLEEKVTKNPELEIITDHANSDFGKWYNSYDSKKNNIMFLVTFKKFDEPHRALYGIAAEIEREIRHGDADKALELFKRAKTKEFKQIISLFNELKNSFAESKKEIVIVFEGNNNFISMAVDEIIAIEELGEFETEVLANTSMSSSYISGIAKRKNGDPVFVINHEEFLNQYSYLV